MNSHNSLQCRPLLALGVLLLCVALLYGISLAPDVLWGDDAMFQLALAKGTLTNHAVWGLLARLFVRLPVGNPAFRANLASAVYGVGAVAFLYLAALAAGGRVRAAVAAGAGLALSHTFWLESVRAEVYTLHLLIFFAGLWMLLRWRRGPEQRLWLYAGLIVWAIGTYNHLLLTMALPGGAWLVWNALAPGQRKRALVAGVLVSTFGLLGLWFLARGFFVDVVLGAARVVVETFSFSLPRLAMHLVLLVYQLPLLGIFTLPGVRRLSREDRPLLIGLATIIVCTAAFSSTHGILESYVFYLPATGLIALMAGLGFERWTGRRCTTHWLAVVVLAAMLQVGLYRLTSLVVNLVAPGVIPSRNLPGREAATFFLWPPKTGYQGARTFAESTLDLLPANSILIADWTLQTPLRYLQLVEQRRPDVLVVQVDPIGLDIIWQNKGQRPLYLANDDPRYYPLGDFLAAFRMVPVGQIHRLELKEGGQ